MAPQIESAFDAHLPFQIGSLTNNTLNITQTTYSLQDAFSPYAFDSTFRSIPRAEIGYMFPNACGSDPDAQNCTTFCTDPSSMFANLDTLSNCMVYPTIADRYANGVLSVEDQRWADKLGILKSKINDTVSVNVTLTVQACMTAYCSSDSLPGCKEDSESYLHENPEDSFLNLTSTFYFPYYSDTNPYFDICNYLTANVNQDIGGLGVRPFVTCVCVESLLTVFQAYASYWIQSGLVLLCFVLVLLWKTIYHLCFAALVLPLGSHKADRIAHRIHQQLGDKQLPTLTAAMTELQKTQCFFMLAINIAAQIIRNKGGLEPTSLQQIYNTDTLIQIVSISGFLPITLTLFSLHLVNMVSWYLLVLSTCTFAVSIATLYTIPNFNPRQADLDFLSQQASKGTYPSCGNHNPFVYCFAPLGYTRDISSEGVTAGATRILAFCIVIFVLVVLAHSGVVPTHRRTRNLSHSMFQRPWARLGIATLSEKLKRLEAPSWTKSKGRAVKESVFNLLRRNGVTPTDVNWPETTTCMKIFVATVYTLFAGLFFYYLSVFFRDLAWFSKNQAISNTWGFGQIVALTVWTPPLCEFIHLEMSMYYSTSIFHLLS